MPTSKLMLAAIGVVTVLYAVMVIGLMASISFRDWNGAVVAIVGLGLSIAGLLLAIPRPHDGFVVGMLGIGISFLIMPWLFPFYLPLPIILGYRLVRWQDATRTTTSAPGG